jgi:Methane oxygenase PmoA
LAFVLGEINAGASQTVTLEEFQDPTRDAAPKWEATVAEKLDRVVLRVAGKDFATYIIRGCRRPYFWPVLGPSGGSVVRGQGSSDHPHHTGLGLSYGGHSEGGSANIWSDWDEPSYGPGGRMLHHGLRRCRGGPVFGEVVQDLVYVDAFGEPIATEIRTVRWWWASHSLRFLDFEFAVTSVVDKGPRPFILAVRAATSFAIPRSGVLSNSAGIRAPDFLYAKADNYRAGWVDMSGPSAGPPPEPPAGPPEDLADLRPDEKQDEGDAPERPWNGIAVFDHPTNDGYPNVVGKYAMAQQITQTHYPPADVPDGPFSFRQRRRLRG